MIKLYTRTDNSGPGRFTTLAGKERYQHSVNGLTDTVTSLKESLCTLARKTSTNCSVFGWPETVNSKSKSSLTQVPLHKFCYKFSYKFSSLASSLTSSLLLHTFSTALFSAAICPFPGTRNIQIASKKP